MTMPKDTKDILQMYRLEAKKLHVKKVLEPLNLHDIYRDVHELPLEEQRKIRLRLLMQRHTEKKRLIRPFHQDDHSKPIQFVVYTNPCPYITSWKEGDPIEDDLKPIFFTSFQQARKVFNKLKIMWITAPFNSPSRASDLDGPRTFNW